MQLKFLYSSISFSSDHKVSFSAVIWFTFALIAVFAELFHHSVNNYLIFKNVFWHVIYQKNLYSAYPAEYEDHNFYGPVFSFVIAPFAVLPDWTGVIALALPLLRYKLYQNIVFQLFYVCLALITVVIYSTSAESSTYIIAMTGVALWFVINMHKKSNLNAAVLVFTFFITSLASTDLVPQFLKHDIVRHYALKALPCFIVWIILIYNIAFKKEEELETPELKLN